MVPKVRWLFYIFLLLALESMGQVGFIENRGQWEGPFIFRADLAPGISAFIEKQAITFNITNFQHQEEEENHLGKTDYNHLHGHAFRIVFQGASLIHITPMNPLPGHENFFLGRKAERWATGLKKYRSLIIKEAWPGIDIELEIKTHSLKYAFVLKNGKDIQNIRLSYEGLDEIRLINGELQLRTSLGDIIEKEPIAWTRDGQRVPINYQLLDNDIKFVSPEGLKVENLIIDPELIFSTYSGSTADNWGYCGTYAPDHAVYSGGIVFNTGYPVSIGAWQQNFAGMCDAGIMKYDSSGTQRLWATYLGGQYADIPHSMIVNERGELVVMGTTGSPDFPTTFNAYDTTFNGGTPLNYASLNFPQGSDLFVAVLNETGTVLKGSSFIGGNGNDGLNFRQRYSSYLISGNDSLYYNYGDGARGEVIIGANDEIIVGSCTFSSDFPVTSGSPQPIHGGKQDGVIFKFDRYAQTLLWSTYCGGSGDDAIYSIDQGNDGSIYFAGGTNSNNLPISAGAWMGSRPGGSADGFAGRLFANTSHFEGLTYFGSSAYDQVYFIKTGPDGYPYLFGQTKAPANTLMINATYGQSNSGQFLAKLLPNLNGVIWSTVFGTGDGKPNISPTAFLVDVCNRIYISGWGRIFGNSVVNGVPYPWGSIFGTIGLPVTPDALQTQTDGQDFYVAVFSPNATGLEYATFFGELHYTGCSYSGHDHVDGGTSRFDPQGNIIQSVCASCGSCQQFPTFPNPGAWSNTNNSWNCNNAVFKIKLLSDFALASFQQPPSGCAPYTVQFQNTGRGSSYEWDFGDPSSGPNNTSTQTNPMHTYEQPGIYQVQLIACLSGSCNGCDTLTRYIQVFSDTTIRLDTLRICKGTWVQAGMPPVPGSTASYQWIPSSGLNASNISNPLASPLITTDYLCLVSYSGCTDTLLQRIEVANTGAFAGNDTTVCSPWFQLIATSGSPGSNFLWSSSNIFSDTLNLSPSDSTAWINLLYYGSHSFYLKVVNASCTAVDSINIIFGGTAIETGTNREICHGDTVHLHATNLFPTHTVDWSWEPSASILGNNQQATVIAAPDSTTRFVVTATTAWGCIATDSVWVEVSKIRPNTGSLNCSCHNLCNGSAWVAPAGGFPPYAVTFSNGASGNLIQQLCPGNYHAYIIDSLGCDTTVQFTISAPESFKITALITQPQCHGDSTGVIQLQISGGTPPYLVHWSNGATGNLINGLAAGSYIAWIADVNDCDTFLVFQLNQPPAYHINYVSQNPSCHGGQNGSISLTIQGATPPYKIVWNTGAQGDSLLNLPAGIYTAMVLDSLGCDTLVNILLTEPEPLQVSAQCFPPQCPDDNTGSIKVNITGGTAPYALNWSTGDTSALIQQLAQGSYSLHIVDAQGCVIDTAFMLMGPLPYSIHYTLHHVSCMGWSNGSIAVNVNGATPPYNYQWSTGQNSSSIYNLSGGNYTLTITDIKQCDTSIAFVILEADSPLQAEFIKKEPSCFGYTDGQIITRLFGGFPPYEMIWSTGYTGDTLKNVSAGVYTVHINDFTGCKLSLSDTLLQPDSISIKAQVVNQRCGGGEADGSIQLDIEGGQPPYAVSWDNGMMGLNITNLNAGSYRASITDSNGCQKYYYATIKAPPKLSVTLIIRPATCHDKADGGATLLFSGGVEPYSLQWADEAGDENPRNDMALGFYPFILVDAAQCSLKDTAFIPAPAPLSTTEIITPPSCEVPNNATIQIEATGGTPPYRIVWEDGSFSFYRGMLAPAVYGYTLTDLNQCQYTDTLEIKPPDCNLFIPNVFTPNGDGFNDCFIIKGIEKFPNNQLLIFNRWGRELIQFKGYKNEWDGKDATGNPVAEGVYYFILKLSNNQEFHGSVTIIK